MQRKWLSLVSLAELLESQKCYFQCGLCWKMEPKLLRIIDAVNLAGLYLASKTLRGVQITHALLQ